MSGDSRHKKSRSAAFSAFQFIVILLFSSFVVTASFFLFFNFIDIPEDKLQLSALSTLGNVIFISLLMWVFYSIYKKMTVDKPVKRIIGGLKKITGGDFTERIQTYAFNEKGDDYRQLFNSITGGFVIAIVVGISVYMIIRGTKKIRMYTD